MKAKKATAGEREVMRQYNVTMDQVRGRTCYTLAARDIDRLIARERWKERERCISCVRGLTRFWDNTDERDEVEEMLDRIIDDINEGSNR